MKTQVLNEESAKVINVLEMAVNIIRDNKNNKMHLDDILVQTKLFGVYYTKCMVLVAIAFLFNSFYSTNFVFVADEVTYRCKDDRFINNTCSSLSDSTDVCTEWVYDDPHSFMAEFQLACQEWKRTLVGTVHSFGYMIGLLLVGPLSDKFGRKKTIAIIGMLGGVIGTVRSFVTSYWVYILLEFLEASIGDMSSPVFMYSVEIVDHDKRLLFQFFSTISFSVGYSAYSLISWLSPYWRHLLRILYIPSMFMIFYIFLMDESPRWLLSRGKKDEAIAVINKIVKTSNIKIDKEVLNNITYEDNKGIPLIQLLKITVLSKTLMKRFFICLSWWIASTFVNYGMQINSVSLQGNKYINFALLTVPELLAGVISTTLLRKFRRKMPLAWTFFLATLFCGIQPFVPMDFLYLSSVFFMVGKLMSSIYFYMTYIYTSELFPTYTRNSMHALCSSIGRIGSIIAPQTPLLIVYWSGAPALVFGLASLMAGLVTLLAPDTADDALPDNVQQAEELGTKQPAES